MAPSVDGRTFAGVTSSASGEVGGDTVFHYRERDGAVWAEYGGGSVVRGFLVGTRTGDRDPVIVPSATPARPVPHPRHAQPDQNPVIDPTVTPARPVPHPRHARIERDGHLVAFNRTFEELGFPFRWSEDEYAVLLKIGGGKERLGAYLAARSDRDLGSGGELDEKIVAAHKRKSEIYLELVEQGRLPGRWGR